MNLEIRKIKKEEADSLARVGANAFPGGGNSQENVCDWIEGTVNNENPNDTFYGAFQGQQLVGGMRYLNYQMNLLSQKIEIGGLGFVCVDLLHKKEKIAKAMLNEFINHYRDNDVNMVMLYPFSIPFYKKMGFGIGTKMHRFEIKPTSFPKGDSKEHLSFYTEEDNEQLLDFYNRFVEKTNGMIFRNKFNLSKKIKTIVYKEDGLIKGYMTFLFEQIEDCQYLMNLRLYGFLYENQRVLKEFSTFLHTQADQVERIIYTSQDDALSHYLTDPSNGHHETFKSEYLESYISAPGAMYRVTNVGGIFDDLSDHNFGGQDCKLKVTVRDTFIPENDGSTVIEFEKGEIKDIDTVGESDVEVTLDISDFSSLLVGGINFKSLYKYGLVSISDDNYIDILEKIFLSDKPFCTTFF